jgi:uncharacterized OsmC-like protein
MSVKVGRINGLKFKAVYNNHEIIAGRIDNEHEPEGMSPSAIMIAGLGLCTATRTVEQIMKRGCDVKGLDLEVKTKSSKDLNLATSFDITINLEADLSEEQRLEILKEAQRCFVANTIKSSPKFTYTLNLVESINQN